MENLTEMEQRIYDLLRDGRIHSKSEVHAVMYPEDVLGSYNSIKMNVSRLRSKLQTQSLDIVFQQAGRTQGYRMIREMEPIDE